MQVPFQVRDVRSDGEALRELVALGASATPAILVGEQLIVGFQPQEIRQALQLDQPGE